MTQSELSTEYFNWMCQLITNTKRHSTKTLFKTLLYFLHTVPFRVVMAQDGNRAEDGIELRYRFGRRNGYPDYMIAEYLDDHPCSVLEMMVALAVRCEEHIMEDDEYGDRTWVWFWDMIDSLGLGHMTNSRFDVDQATDIIDRFLDREYDPDGSGGLFTVPGKRDLRTIEIWYQMQAYLETQS